MLRFFLFLSVLFFSNFSFAVDEVEVVAVGEATIVKDVILFHSNNLNKITRLSFRSKAKAFLSILKKDFSFYKKNIEIKDSINPVNKKGRIDFEKLKKNEIHYLADLNFKYDLKLKEISVEIKLYHIKSKKIKYETEVNINLDKIRSLAHTESNAFFYTMTGKISIFKSRIIFVSDRTRTKASVIKELYIMDFDGFNKTQLTKHGGIVISPSISHDGDQVLYSLIPRKNRKNVNLWMLDLKTNKNKLISSRRGINSGAIFSDKKDHIYLTLSHSGNAEIYELNLKNKKSRKITRHSSPDVDPSLSFDGKILTFLSGRSGPPMIFTLDPNSLEKNVTRISYVGQFNATPRFSPDGKEIAFSSWLDNRFDIFRIGANGKGLVRLTKDFGSNEDPTYSNDGQFLAFSSQRVISRKKAVQKIYIIDREGENMGSLTSKYGNCITPRWTKSLNL